MPGRAATARVVVGAGCDEGCGARRPDLYRGGTGLARLTAGGNRGGGGKVAALDYWKEGGGGGGSDERVDDDGEERRGVWEDGAPGGRSAPLDLRVREGGRLRSSF